jgi:hypothetical protein
MRIDEAIRELDQDLVEAGERKPQELREAQRLAIAGLKRILYLRKRRMLQFATLLPGETRQQGWLRV